MASSIPATADGLELAAAIRRGDFSSDELLARVNSRIDEADPAIAAVVARWPADRSFEREGRSRACRCSSRTCSPRPPGPR